MKKLALLLVLCLGIAGMTGANADEVHCFLDIPFEGTTVENINE